MIKRFWPFLLIILLAIPAILALLHPGFFPSDDGEWMVVRLSDFHRSIVSGQIPVRWASRLYLGFGYPVFNFLYPLSLYFGELFHLVGFNFVNSIKLVFLLSFIFSGLSMYLLIRSLWGVFPGLVSAVIYIYAPYRFVDVYVRGSIGEALGFVFIPLIFWAIYGLKTKFSQPKIIVGGFAFAGLIMSHNIMAMLFSPVIILVIAWTIIPSIKPKELIWRYSGLLLISFGTSAFFWLPAVYDQKFTLLNQITVTNYWEHFVDFKKLIIPSWGYGPSGAESLVSYQLGLIILLAVVGSLFFYLKNRRKPVSNSSIVLPFLFAFLFATVFMLPISQPLWAALPFIKLTQFPWRLLAITVFTGSVLAGCFIASFPEKIIPKLTVVVIILTIALNYNYAHPQSFVDRGEGFYTTNEASTTVKDEYLPVWVTDKPLQKAPQKVQILTGNGLIKNLVSTSRKTTFTVSADENSAIQINTFYFPGWVAYLDDQPVPISYQNPAGLVNLSVPVGTHEIALIFQESGWRLVADLISFLTIVTCGFLLIRRFTKKSVIIPKF
jgi:hypothetical protein